jgi:hypothetical protein
MKNSNDSGIEPATFWFVAHFLNQLQQHVHPNIKKMSEQWVGNDVEGNACRLIRGTVQAFSWKSWGKPCIDCVPGEDRYESLPDSYHISCGLNVFKIHQVKFNKPLFSTVQMKVDNLIQAADGNRQNIVQSRVGS